MTGMGRIKGLIDSAHFIVETRSVNHRYCEVSVRLPGRLAPLEFQIVQFVKKKIARGKVDIWVGEEKGGSDDFSFNDKMLTGYYTLLCQIRKKLKIAEPVSLTHLQQGASYWMSRSFDPQKYWPGLKKLVEKSLGDLIKMRGKEGAALQKNIESRLKVLEGLKQTVALKSEEIFGLYKKKLEGRIEKILGGVEVDSGKLANEVAFYADRSDMSEELERLASHFSQMRQLIRSATPSGRALDFLIQEINREWNTIASKSQDASLSHQAVTAKGELEKVREQVQNIE